MLGAGIEPATPIREKEKKGIKEGMLGAGIELATPSYARNELKGRKGTRGVGIDPTTSRLKEGGKFN